MNNITLINFTNLNKKEKKLILLWRNDPHVKEWMYNDKIITLENHLKYIEELRSDSSKLYFLVKQDDQYIGVIDFTEIDKEKGTTKFGLYSNINLRGKGETLLKIVNEYAFETLKLDKLIAEVFEDNEKAINLYEKSSYLYVSTKMVNNRKILCMELNKNQYKMNKEKRILIVAAHPDDEVLGCFGTVAKLINEGYEAYTLILGNGKTSRYSNKEYKNLKSKYRKEIDTINTETKRANELIGIKKVYQYNFPDNRFDSVDLLDIVKVILKIKEEIKPSIIFTHYENDLNIDHQIAYKAVITATRPMKNESVKEIYSFEILSSTEWNYPLSFLPDTFFDISETLELKQKAMAEYKSELCKYPHPRSLKGIKLNAKYHGMRVGRKYIETFKQIRAIK